MQMQVYSTTPLLSTMRLGAAAVSAHKCCSKCPPSSQVPQKEHKSPAAPQAPRTSFLLYPSSLRVDTHMSTGSPLRGNCLTVSPVVTSVMVTCDQQH